MQRLPLCTRDHCALRDPTAGPDHVAELALASLTGRELGDVLEDGAPMPDRKICLNCIQRVMRGRPALPTPDQVARDEEAARAFHRRERRQRRAQERSGC